MIKWSNYCKNNIFWFILLLQFARSATELYTKLNAPIKYKGMCSSVKKAVRAAMMFEAGLLLVAAISLRRLSK